MPIPPPTKIETNFKFPFIPSLNGLRGVAVLAVMLFHIQAPHMQGAYIGVDIFFVLSGFLITTLLISEYDTLGRINLKNFYMRRALRLLPALLFLLIVFMLYSLIAFDRPTVFSNLKDSLISLFYIANWTRAFGLNIPDMLGHTWSLSIEEQYYIIWPLTLILLTRFISSRKWLSISVFFLALVSWLIRILLLSSGSSIDRVYNGLDTRMDSLLIGCTLGVLLASGLLRRLQENKSFKLSVHYILAPISVAGLAIVIIFTHLHDPSLYYWILFVVEIFTALLVLDILTPGQSLIKRLLEIRVIVWVGSISYGLYLWHYPIMKIVAGLQMNVQIKIFLAFFFSFLAATISFYLIEKPILRLKSRYKQ
jgi:peptidoglycan/LPS O-acetylase OafA/YrhL